MKQKPQRLTLARAAAAVGVSSITLKRWLLAGKVGEVARDRNGWRVFTTSDVERIRRYALAQKEPSSR